MSKSLAQPSSLPSSSETTFFIIGALSFSHLLNDMMQSLLAAIYPVLKTSFALDFGQIGLITLAYQVTASLLQPAIGLATDKRPLPYALAVGMGFTLAGLLMLSMAHGFPALLAAAALVGVGSAVFHPDASRVARLASGGRHGLAQSLFQVGGNIGQASGPLLAAFVVVSGGQGRVAWFAIAALVGMVVLGIVGRWYSDHLKDLRARPRPVAAEPDLPRGRVLLTLGVLCGLVFSKFVYMASFNSYYTFYLIETFGLSIRDAQLHLFLFLGAVAAGTVAGGTLGDRFGRKIVIWVSILGVLPFTLMLPYADLFWTSTLTVVIGLVLASAFPAIVVYAQELMPGRVGMVAGLFFGLGFGIAGISAALLGELADWYGIAFVYRVCAFLPAIGLIAVLLPDLEGSRRPKTAA
ncbi:Fosmidomycin resistance protein [Hartmannibacter diazotrophicus]|uniref:Fosmidomycin resistance protein n=1 Tax=Hartmannibacter diazotrophicus TaxID=1482074 RepID=A0A2C9DAA7_9HYPH|nr:MFS transporter [Hartmannibacter diazotrophicus]SON56535.1 Fosmidomycin resistance protein [Hartmannibacter diazotrophicus]